MTSPALQPLPKRLDSIQALRGIAAMLVLFFHIAEFQRQFLISGSPEYELTRGFWDRGGNGVDLFFVISGFIMVYVSRDFNSGMNTARQFLWARITRIYPLWWVCSGIMALYFWVSYGMPAAPDRVSGPGQAWSYALKSFALLPQDSPPMLGVGWTLIHEMFFYLIFTLSLIMARKNLVSILCVWAGLTVFSSAILGASITHSAIGKIIFSPLSLEFIAGAFAALAVLKFQSKSFPPVLYWSVIVSLLLYVFFIMQTGFHIKGVSDPVNRTVIYAGPIACLVFMVTHMEMASKLIVSKAWRILGDWSYSLYLTHFIVLVSMRRILRIFEPSLPQGLGDLIITDRAGALNNVVFAILAIILCLFTAWFFYKFIERPALAYFRRARN